MKDFLQALRFSWPYRGRIILSVTCALVAALFWSANFSAVYPVLKLIGSDQNLQEMASIHSEDRRANRTVAKTRHGTESSDAEIARQPESPEKDRSKRQIAGELARLEYKLEILRHLPFTAIGSPRNTSTCWCRAIASRRWS